MKSKVFRFALICAILCSVATTARAEIRVKSDEAVRAAVTKIPPEYPLIAKQVRVVGKVVVELTIDTQGNVEDVKVISGNPLLTRGISTALKKWKFTPFTGADGEPTKALASIDIDFKP